MATCVTLAESDGKLTEEQRKQLVQTYGDQAMQMLHEVFKRRYRGGEALKTNAIFKMLRPRDDFQKLVRELEAKPKG